MDCKIRFYAVFALLASGCISTEVERAPNSAPAKAVAFLSREVPAWHKENHCFSCHNNGDGARALYLARTRGYDVPPAVLVETSRWLNQPADWKNNRGDPGYSDPQLANIQFAAALAASGGEARALRQAAEMLIEQQSADGAWRSDADHILGSPVTYGSALSTLMGIRVLEASGFPGASERIAKARAWMHQLPIENVPVAASLALAGVRQSECLSFLRRGQKADGGWGPYTDSPTEVFDTALAILGLATLLDHADAKMMVEKGRLYLQGKQSEGGSWPATTRPPGGQSYAQQISTTAWAAIALVSTED